jgi:hypothetical protein
MNLWTGAIVRTWWGRVHGSDAILTQRRICAGSCTIWTGILATCYVASPAAAILTVLIHVLGLLGVLDAIHRVVYSAIVAFFKSKVGSASRTATLTLIVAGERVSACKLSATLRTFMRPLSCVQFGVALEIMQSSKA